MSATPRSNLALIDGIPAQQMLEGLANLHQSVVVTDTEGRVLWASRALERTLGGASRSVDFSPDLSSDLNLEFNLELKFDLAALCDRYLETQCEAVHTSSQRSREPGVGRSPEPPRLSRQIAEILRHLEQRGSLCHYRIEASWPEAHGTELEINAFRVDSRGPETERGGSPQIVPLNVIILRPAPKLEASAVSPGDMSSFYRSVLDLLPEATLTIDQSGFISYANARVVSLLGTSRGELIDTPISLYIPSSAILPINTSFDREFEPIERSVVELAPPGRPKVYVEVAIRKLDLPDGTTAGRIIQLRDTTNQLRVSERFKQKIASLESYVHTVSHDLRSPLVSLLGFTRLMKQDYGRILDETGRRFLNRIEQAGANMNTMTLDLLELSTREAPSASVTPVDPHPILLQIQAELKPRLEERGIDLELPAAPPMIQCNRTQLYQIFSNLIGNALQHMGPSDQPRIKVEIYPGADQQVIVVRDNGRGIAREAHEQIFDAFRSLSSNAGDEAAGSSGVGLAIVKKIALAHQGRVWVDSEPGCGAAFHVSLRYIRPDDCGLENH